MINLHNSVDLSKTGVYQIKNTKNGKIYIGSTATNFKKRYFEHLNSLLAKTHYSCYLQRSFNKYGEDSFEFTIIEICEPNQCITIEQKWLDTLKPYEPNIGYNTLMCSHSSLGFKHSEESLILIGQRSKERGPHINSINAMKKANIGRKPTKKMIEKLLERTCKPVVQLDLDGKFIKEWGSGAEAARGLNLTEIQANNIMACTRHKCKSVANFIWVKKENYNSNITYKYKSNKNVSKPVFQYTLDNIFIKEWTGAKIAAIFYNIDEQGIYDCVNGKNQTCNSFKWYKEKI